MDNEEKDFITEEEYDKLFEQDENGAFVRLVIPANEPTEKYTEELNLIGKPLLDYSKEEAVRMKKYCGKMYEKIK